MEYFRVLTEKLPPKELQRRGVCLLKLVIGGRKTGLYGRTILSFEASGGIKELPSHNITPGINKNTHSLNRFLSSCLENKEYRCLMSLLAIFLNSVKSCCAVYWWRKPLICHRSLTNFLIINLYRVHLSISRNQAHN